MKNKQNQHKSHPIQSLHKPLDQSIPYKINPRRNMPRHIAIKLTKTKDKERILKAAREKQQVTYKGNPIYLTAIFQQKLCRSEGNGRIYLKY